MGETSSKEELLQLIKRVGSYLSVKISNLFPFSFLNLDSRSVGAIAGLAFAIVFTWRIFRSPSAPQRRQPKRSAPASSTSVANTLSNVTLTPSEACSSSEDLQAQNVDEFFQLVKPTLGQIVRQKLSEGRKVTCRLLGVILEESSPEELQKQATVRSSVLEVLLEITKFCDLYLMERVLDDESEQKVLTALENAGVFTSDGLVKDKVLFCSTENGRSSFVRQLEPDWHIDSNPEIVSQLAVSILVVSFIILIQQCCSTIMILLLSSQCCLTKFLLPLVQRFIKFQLHVSPIISEWTAANVFSSPSLEQFFGCI